jgi:hypothetical protein
MLPNTPLWHMGILQQMDGNWEVETGIKTGWKIGWKIG